MQATTQAKMLETVYKKICEAFEIKFIPLRQFEEEITHHSKLFLDSLVSLPEIYNQLKKSESKEIISAVSGVLQPIPTLFGVLAIATPNTLL